MSHLETQNRSTAYEWIVSQPDAANSNEVTCDWRILRLQLLQQWDRISGSELDATGHNRHRIAKLIQRKYGVSSEMAENYLYNFERTLPLIGCA